MKRTSILALLALVAFILAGCAVIRKIQGSLPPKPIAIFYSCQGCLGESTVGEVPLVLAVWPSVDLASCMWTLEHAGTKTQLPGGCYPPTRIKLEEAGVYTLSLAASDERGKAYSASIQFLALAPSQPFSADAKAGKIVSCVQKAPRAVPLDTEFVVFVACTVLADRAEYIIYRIETGSCAYYESDEIYREVLHVPRGKVWAFSYVLRATIASECLIRGRIHTASGSLGEEIVLTVPTSITP